MKHNPVSKAQTKNTKKLLFQSNTNRLPLKEGEEKNKETEIKKKKNFKKTKHT